MLVKKFPLVSSAARDDRKVRAVGGSWQRQEMDRTHIQMSASPQGSHSWRGSWCWDRISFPKRTERSAQGTQGHTRTGDNEIRVNEGWKKPRPDGLVKLSSEMQAEARRGISGREKTAAEAHVREVLGNKIQESYSHLWGRPSLRFHVTRIWKWMSLGRR